MQGVHRCKDRKGTSESSLGGGIFRVLRNVLLTQHRVDGFLLSGQRKSADEEKKSMNKVKHLICAIASEWDTDLKAAYEHEAWPCRLATDVADMDECICKRGDGKQESASKGGSKAGGHARQKNKKRGVAWMNEQE